MSKLDLVDEFEMMHEVARLHMQGNNDTQVGEILSIKRVEVKRYIEQWRNWLRKMASSNTDVKDRIFDILFEVDQHYALVIKEAWSTSEQADNLGELRNKISALKLVADIQKQRADMFQKAGVNQDTEIMEQMQRQQREHEILEAILREVTADCEHCKLEVRRRLAEISSEAEVIDVVGEET